MAEGSSFRVRKDYMDMENRNTNQDGTSLKTLWVLLSALGLLIIVGASGFFFFAPDKNTGAAKPVLAATTPLPVETPEEFDPIEWARKSEEYPELMPEEEGNDSFIVELVPEEEMTAEKPEETPEPKPAALPVVTPKPEPVKPAAEPEIQYKEIQEKMYWIQAGSYTTMTKAESVSDYLKEKGLSSTVQVKSIDGIPRYRVRIGAFNTEEEAEKFNSQVQGLSGFEESYVSQVFIKKKVPVNP